MTVQVRISFAASHSEFQHRWAKVLLPQCWRLLQTIHCSFQSPEAVLPRIVLFCWNQHYTIHHECMKKRSAYVTSKIHDHVLDNIITSSTVSVTSVGVLANRVSWSMFSWKHPRAVSLHLTVFAVFQRFTHLQSSAESMSSCEHCSIGTSSYTSNSFMLFMSFCVPSMTSSSGNSGSVLNSWGSFSLISVCFSSVSSFTATGTSVPSFKVTEKTPIAAIVSRLSSGSKSSGSSWFSAVCFLFLTLVSGGRLASVSVVSSVSSFKSFCVSVAVS